MNRFTKYQGAISDARPQIGGDLFGIMVLVILLGIFSLSGCQDSFMKQTTADKTSAIASLTSEVDAAGNVTATFDPNSGQTQVLKLASGALAGSAVAIPPGSLAIPVSITVGEGETLASSTFTQQIGLTDNSVTAAGPSVSFIPSTNVQASSPLTLSLPFSMASLALTAIDTENVIVMFRAIKVDGDQTTFEMGIIPRSDVTISSDKVSFQTKQFGVFQLAKTEKKITQRVVQETIEAPVLKKEAANPVLGAWESCRLDGSSDGVSTGTNIGTNTGTSTPGPLTWMNVSANGYFDQSLRTWNSKVLLNWSGGFGPYKITRYTEAACSGVGFDLPSVSVNQIEDTNIPAAKMLYYKIADSQNNSSKCRPVQVITELEKIRWSAVEYGAATAKASWAGPGASFIISTYPQYGCQGQATTVTSTSKNYTFTIPNVGGFSAKLSDSNHTVTSSCLDLKTVQDFSPSLGEVLDTQPGIRLINSIGITGLSAEGGDSNFVVKFAATAGVNYTATRFSAPGCPASQLVNSITPTTNGTIGTMQDLVKSTELGMNQSPSYLLVQSGTTSLSQCVNFLPIDNRISALRIYNVTANPTSVEFTWSPDGVNVSSVELYQHQGMNCIGAGTRVPLNTTSAGAILARHKIPSLAKMTDYSFKLKTTDSSAPDVCFNATTTDGDLPYIMPDAETTLVFRASTNVTDGNIYKLWLSLAGKQVDLYSSPFDKSKNATNSALIQAKGKDLLNKNMMVLAPHGCQFVLGDNKFMNFSINESNTLYDFTNKIATVTTDALQIECNSSQPGDSVGNQQEGSGIGALGSVPGRNYSRLNKLKIGKDAYIMRQDVFPSKDCTGFPVSSNTEQGVFALPAIDLEGTIPIDVTQKDLDGAIFTQEGVDIANKRPLEFGCGLSGWVKGVVRKLSDSKKCGEVGRTYYERLKVDGDRLYMCSSGQNKDYGSTPDMRVPSCDITSDMEYFTRQK